MDRFKDRAWRLFGVKVPSDRRPAIKARYEARREKWHRGQLHTLLSKTILRHADAFCDLITKDFILYDLIRNPQTEPPPGGIINTLKMDLPDVPYEPAFSREIIVDRELIYRPIFRGAVNFPVIEELIPVYKSCEAQDHTIDALRYTTIMSPSHWQAKNGHRFSFREWFRLILQGGRRWVSIVKMRLQGKTD